MWILDQKRCQFICIMLAVLAYMTDRIRIELNIVIVITALDLF